MLITHSPITIAYSPLPVLVPSLSNYVDHTLTNCCCL